jgi:lipopolysaccharide biosynthesis glycosyltransferase
MHSEPLHDSDSKKGNVPVKRVVCAANSAYALPLAVTLFSVASTCASDAAIEFQILDTGLTDSDRERVQRCLARSGANASARFVPVPASLLADLPETRHTRSTFARFFISELIPHDDPVLYLDCDLIALRSVEPLFSIDLGTCVVAATRDYGLATLDDSGILDDSLDLKAPVRAVPYFNAGVMLIDAGRWRKARIGEQALDWTKKHPDRLQYSDQNALNAVLSGRWLELDPRWNVQVAALRAFRRDPLSVDVRRSVEDVDAVESSPFILHFTSGKPWRRGGLDRFSRRWYSVAARTRYHSLSQLWWIRLTAALRGVRARAGLMSNA